VTVTGGSATWVNNLEVDGSITVATVLAPPTLNFTPTGGGLQFSWTGSGYKLQAQTNSLSVGISNNWGDYPGGGTSPVTVPVDVDEGSGLLPARADAVSSGLESGARGGPQVGRLPLALWV
jgi:hypothetical protein